MLSLGPAHPLDDVGPAAPVPAVWPAQPGLLLITFALAILVLLVAREVGAAHRRPKGERSVDDLVVSWLPPDAAAATFSAAALAREEELLIGPVKRSAGRQRPRT